ncbi:hypothetical protein ACFQY0_08445 [Haloferula chungangensis]|uniref:Verru_Chthon cassette protein A n=2 Tax=Haloferula chungangensis TaxID=1048331 RepID=A0ABW2L7G5_9BACT
MMMLLTLVALGLLSLSSISLRTASRGSAMAEARENARLALTLAIGELQKTLGPDKAITATSGILSENPAKNHITGVWDSWDYDISSSSLDYDSEKSSRFRKWLVSTASPNDAETKDFGNAAWNEPTVELVGDHSYGGSSQSPIVAGLVPVSDGTSSGAFAWHVSDESTKARINLYRDPDLNDTLSRKRALLAGHRPDVSVIKGVDGGKLDFLPNDLTAADYLDSEATTSKVISLNQVGLLPGNGNSPEKIKAYRDDVTPYSLGLLTDARNGGLKQDLSSIFEMSNSATSTSLPSEFADRKLYDSTHGVSGVSDPYWDALASYYNIFRGVTQPDTDPSFAAQLPQAVSLTDLGPQKTFTPGPVIQKVEMLFTYVTRDSHASWTRDLAAVNPRLAYMGHLVFSPLVTLHNPYNISISFDKLDISMANLPVAFRFSVNDSPQNKELVSMNDLFFQSQFRKEVVFNIQIANWESPGSGSTSEPITLKPGQTLVCSPYLDPDATFNNRSGFFNYTNNLTSTIKSKPGYSGRSMGYDVDWLTPIHNGLSAATQNDGKLGVLGLRDTDSVKIEYAIRQPSIGVKDSFQVSAKVTTEGTSKSYGGLVFTYNDDANLEKLYPEIFSYPEDGSFEAMSAYVPNTEALSNHAKALTFGVFSAYARTTSGGVYDNGTRTPTKGALNFQRDGRLAGMPYLFHNPAQKVVNIDLGNVAPAAQSHELNFQGFTSNGQAEDYFNLDVTNRTAAITGNSTQRGIKSGSYFELPTGPMQTIADFRRSNALTSSYLPNYVQPVSNSRISPLMSTDKVTMSDPTIASYELLDHSTLSNHALYDRFYFSTFASDGDRDPGEAFDGFMSGESRLLSQAFQPYLPPGETSASASEKLFKQGVPMNHTYQEAAGYQMVRGAFNVNSTSIRAWKAKLASMNHSEIATLWAKNGGLEIVTAENTPILPMSLTNGGVAGSAIVDAAKIDNTRTNDWNGHQELTDEELELLATRIVDEVRKRGPFLSMSEFVNRRIGPDSELTRMGALEAAITHSRINEKMYTEQVPIAETDLSLKSIYPFNTPLASVGNPASGAPGWVSQGDIMRLLEPAATVRSDTFVIRTYGESRDSAGKVKAKAYAEALVQRMPDYVDSGDSPFVNPYADTDAKEVNKTFGRRMNIISFRWLTSNEI